ncbi:MAG: hypothetical protein IT480_12050 [Gammaproteobacteria bacterium]|nr:hypothetical protein [Gammaproteobacteria bacterium]
MAAEPVDEQFGSTDTPGGCCETQECQQQAYKELERQRYESAQRCVEARSAPCNIQPELKLPPLCPPKLQGKAEATRLEGGVRQDETTERNEPPVFIEQTPTLDPREKRPRSRPPRTIPGDGLRRELAVSGSILKRQELPGDPAAGGTPSTPLTRGYFFSQGTLQGLLDSGPAAGESAMHLHVAAWYVLTGRPQLAQAELQLIPGTSVTVRSLAKDLDDWSRIAAGTANNAGSVQDAFDRGRLLGQQIGGKLLEKYGGTVLEPHGLPVVTEPPPVPGQPAPTDVQRRQGP